MKLRKFFFLMTVLTVLGLLQVHQRVELVKAGYELQRTRAVVDGLRRSNSELRYDLSRLESPSYLLASLQGDSHIQFARRREYTREHIVTARSYDDRYAESGFLGRFVDIFTVDAEASSGR